VIELRPVAVVESALADPALAPMQGHEGAPDAWLVLDPDVLDALDGIWPSGASACARSRRWTGRRSST
jgi:hypothetical protein